MLHVLLNFINSIYSTLSVFLLSSFSLVHLYIFWGCTALNEMAGFKIECLYFLSISLLLFFQFFSLSLFLSLAFPFFFPDDSHWSMKSISHLGTGWHWHAGCAIWRLMAKLYYTIAPEWQSAVSSQLLYLLDVYIWTPWLGCVSTFDFVLFRAIFSRGSARLPRLLTLTNDTVCATVHSFPLKNHDIKSKLFPPFFLPLVFFFLYFCLHFSQKGWLCPTKSSVTTQP